MRITRIATGTCPSNRFPGRSLQQKHSLRNPHGLSAEPAKTPQAIARSSPVARGTHKYVSALSAEMVEGTLPVKRFSESDLRRNGCRANTPLAADRRWGRTEISGGSAM